MPDGAGRASVVEVADRVFAYVQPDGGWFVNNTGFVAGRSEVLSIDTCATVPRTLAYLRAVEDTTRRPIRTVVNTHHHGDHTYGNALVPGATLIGHRYVREALLAWGDPPEPIHFEPVEWGPVEIVPPEVTFDDHLWVHVDEVTCLVKHFGVPAHTLGDAVVWLPEERVLFSGDLLFHGVTPLMSHGSVSGALTVLDRLQALEPQVVVPGHGPVGGPAMIDEVRRYLLFVQGVAELGRSAGLTPLEAAREADLGDYTNLPDSERIVGNLHRCYAELDGRPLGARLDMAAVFGDMVAYNGGRPLSCSA